MEVPDLVDATTSVRRNARAYLLTYSQTSLTKEGLVAAMNRPDIEYLIVGQEKHADGGLHLHAYVIYKKPRDTTYASFDVQGEHPNIKTHKPGRKDQQTSYEDCRRYCSKEDTAPTIIGKFPTVSKKRTRDEVMREARELCVSESVEKALDLLHEGMPFEAAKNEDAFERALTKKRRTTQSVQTPARPLADFPNAPKIPENWRALYLHGETRCGKTQFARALLPEATVVSLADQLRGVDFSKGIIFDDFDVWKWPGVSVIHLLDWDEPRGVNVKHAHVVIPPHTRKIVTFNETIGKWLPESATYNQAEAAQGRFTMVYEVPGGTKLFQPSPPAVPQDPLPEREWGADIPE